MDRLSATFGKKFIANLPTVLLKIFTEMPPFNVWLKGCQDN